MAACGLHSWVRAAAPAAPGGVQSRQPTIAQQHLLCRAQTGELPAVVALPPGCRKSIRIPARCVSLPPRVLRQGGGGRPLSGTNRRAPPARACTPPGKQAAAEAGGGSSELALGAEGGGGGEGRRQELVGEDAAVFEAGRQETLSWVKFTAVLGVVLAVLYYIWLDPGTGYGGAFVAALSDLPGGHEATMVAILAVFALVHSGGAALRPRGESLLGERGYRVLYAGLSLPLAVSAVAYFINHRYDGAQLWQLRTVPGVHELVWALSFVSFFFLYPSTFNLLEVAAVDRPKLHMWETGIMRITRHPQMTGQLIWCLAHTLWIGNSFTLTTSVALLAHHAFGVWHGDRRQSAKYGEAFEVVKSRTSVIPFAAILEGRQVLPPDYYKEFLRVPYFAIIGVTLGAYFSHPLMQIGSHWLHW